MSTIGEARNEVLAEVVANGNVRRYVPFTVGHGSERDA